jgi:ribosomal protein L20A (L18A)
LSQVKTFIIKGELRKHGEAHPFRKELRALKKEDALVQLYADMGSRHKAKKFEVNVIGIEEVQAKDQAKPEGVA